MSSFAVALVCTSGVAFADGPVVEPIPFCLGVPNGQFNSGFDGWTITKSPGGFAHHSEFQDAQIVDLTEQGCDGLGACLTISAYAEWEPAHPSGSASQAQITLSRKVTVTHRYLVYDVTAGFEAILFNDGESRYVAQVAVTDQQNNRVVCDILNYKLGDADFGCGAGVAVLGAIYPCPQYCCDVTGPNSAPTGITIGETVLIEFTWSAVSDALFECDSADFGGSLCVDNVRFCNACLQTAEVEELESTPIDASMKPRP